MPKLKDKKDIWVLTPTKEDLQAGAHYAAVSLPWTFNRMMLNTGSVGQQGRALNIAKGIVGQEMLRRELERRGITAQTQRKSHRDDDLFDFRVTIDGELTKLDLKSVNYYTNYDPLGREPLSSEFIVKHAGYDGADWRTFFPMLVPHTQIEQGKEGYCFAIAASIDLRKDIGTNRIGYALTAFPYGEHLGFFSAQKLCLMREEAKKGFSLELEFIPDSILSSEVTLTVIGEWAGKLKTEKVALTAGKEITVGPFSCIASFQTEKDSYDEFFGCVSVAVKKNEFTTQVLNSLKRNINRPPVDSFVLRRDDFCNLSLPTDYRLYVIGWTRKDDFLQACRKYTGYVWPIDSVDKYKNQFWSQITDDDKTLLTKKGFADSIQAKPRMLKAGWLKTNGRGGGACCYVFPNIGMNGGVKETNLYALPQDLYRMESLK